MRGNGHFTTPSGGTLYISGSENKSANGVGILLPRDIVKHVLGYNPISDRIITIRLNAKPNILNIVQVYAPTEKAKEEDIDCFYESLEATLNTISNREITIILGDWNAKIGNTCNDDLPSIVGNFGLGVRNERGQRLLDYCIERKFCIANTCFQHHPRRLYTWTSPGARYRNQIDYILINSRWKSAIRNVKTFPGAECGTDHNLLVARFTLRLKAASSRTIRGPRTLEPKERTYLCDAVEKKLALEPPTGDANTQWQTVKSHLCESLEEIKASHREGNAGRKTKTKVWISEQTWKLISKRKYIKGKGLQDDDVRKTYSDLCKEIKKACRRDKNCFIADICIEIEKHSQKYQPSDLFKKVRLLSRKFKPRSWIIEDHNGKPITDLNAVVERWRKYCEGLYDQPESMSTQLPVWDEITLEPSIIRSEVTEAISRLKSNKAPGPDHITAEIIKSLGERGVNAVHSICNYVWQHGEWPNDWTKSIILPLHKKGSTRKCDNYRTLALVSHCSKVLLYILNTRLRYFLDWQIPQEQAGFVKGKGTREQILNIRQLIERSYEFGTPMIMCFIDYSKAFDCVKWDHLWKILAELGVPQHLVLLLHSLYINNQGIIRVEETISAPFKFRKGVRQGCILSPVLFNIYGEYIMRRTCEGWDGGVTIGGVKLSNLRYADDTTLLAANESEMTALMSKLEKISLELGLAINRSKTKVMVIDRMNKLEHTGSLHLETTERFIYLGSMIANTGSCEPEIRRRIGIAKTAMSQLDSIWSDRNISIKTKLLTELRSGPNAKIMTFGSYACEEVSSSFHVHEGKVRIVSRYWEIFGNTAAERLRYWNKQRLLEPLGLL
ncbi:transposon TX1 uncharacterized 149 kDa protein [Bombyx mori]|uniref:Reverse transcriptase domain-containing protein n=1 Tax=Bombyx mori TaxID=7091 RepID=A0A8R2G8B9_BOMMO|nr:uncharacterized protein LOC105841345 [Bombyx mori]